MKFNFAAAAILSASIAAPAFADNNVPLPDNASQEIFMNMLSGGWSFNDLKKKNADGSITIIHRAEKTSAGNRGQFAFCVLSTSAQTADPGNEPDVKIRYKDGNRDHLVNVWVGGCVHADGYTNRSMVAEPRREGLILLFKRVK